MGLVIDTSAIVEIERMAESRNGDGDTWQELRARAGDAVVVIPAIVCAEILVGVELASGTKRAGQRRARLEELCARVPVIDFDLDVARAWARLFAALQQSGRMIPANDLAVAATATYLAYGVLVGRGGEKHFRAIDGLEVMTVSA